MGIQGLLPLLKSIQKPTHLRNFAGQTLGVDAYGWLHRGTVACAIELAEGKPTRKHIDFALHRVRMLIHFGVTPYIVFDGDYLPSKSHTEKERAARRKESKRVGLELLRMGRTSQAHLELQKAVDVTPVMARELIEELKRMDVPYVVAPFEADSQLAYLEQQGNISGVLSEDSDLLVFGVKCLLTKLDQYGECIMVNRADFTSCRDISLVGWADKEFRIMAMLSGCDYLPGIDKMGLKTAYRYVRKHKTVERIVQAVQFEGKMKVPPGYLEAFLNAERTFLHQWVFCSDTRGLLNLTPLPSGVDAESMPYIGKTVDAELAAGVACGDLDPNTKLPIVLPQRFQNRFQNPASRSTLIQTPDEKHGKPISDFFKARRTPLAELDPNSFTLSPSQQQTSESQRNASWSASQAPSSRVFGGRRASQIPVPSSAPQVTRRVATAPTPLARLTSPKRQRLCSDSSALAAVMNPVETAASRFFAQQPTQPSPSMRTKSNRSKKEEFDLWSDDSVADAVAAATATPESTQDLGISVAKKRKKLNVLADPIGSPADDSIGDISQESILTTATPNSQASVTDDTPDTSFAEFDSPRFWIKPATSMREKLSMMGYSGPAVSTKTLSRTKSTLPISTTFNEWEASNNVPVAKSRRESPAGPAVVFVPNSSPPLAELSFPSDVAEPDDNDTKDEEWLAIEQDVVHTSLGDSFKGSEDLLVPNSPENDTERDERRPAFSLSRFAFAG
ncbi:unnamed protein product [Zymoseptoria tritici ST99CH_1A5]|uniref:Uncharacterized protein n=1 Tax=Zymoseptoria tritici ST99CH_1A5 TaxID=1276529 RepID=A0A1Y6LX78_ZYMTR|nr:unnamed protein product [Zymoseptoria tritici ST99CH_1A5]